MSDDKCKCSLRESILGDGCKVCQPRTYIAKIEDALQSAESEIEQLEQELAEALAAQAQQESRWISVEEAKATLKDGDLIFAYSKLYGVIEANYDFEAGYWVPHRVIKNNGDSYKIDSFTHIMIRKPAPLPPAPEGE